MNLCSSEIDDRYTTIESLKHPWITRELTDKIPLTIFQKYKAKSSIKKFKEVIDIIY